MIKNIFLNFYPSILFFLVFFILPILTLANDPVKINNPVEGFGTLTGFFTAIIGGMTYIAIPFIVLAFMYSGYLLVSALGNPEKIKKGKNAFFMTVLATFIILGSNLLLELVITTTEEILA